MPPDNALSTHLSTVGRLVFSFLAMLEMVSPRLYASSILALFTFECASVRDFAKAFKKLSILYF